MSKTKLESRLERLAARKPATSSAPHKWAAPPANLSSREPRIPAFKFGAVQLEGGKRLDCMILDLSGAGARISLSGAVNLPETVRLSIPQHALNIDATVRWQRGSEAGLRFNHH